MISDVRICRRRGRFVVGFDLLGGPHLTPAAVERVADAAIRHRGRGVVSSVMTAVRFRDAAAADALASELRAIVDDPRFRTRRGTTVFGFVRPDAAARREAA